MFSAWFLNIFKKKLFDQEQNIFDSKRLLCDKPREDCQEEDRTEDEDPLYSPEEKRTEDADPLYSPEEKRTEDEDPLYSPEEKRTEDEDSLYSHEEKRTEDRRDMTEEEWAGATEDDGGRCMVASVQAGVQLYNDSFLVTLNIFKINFTFLWFF